MMLQHPGPTLADISCSALVPCLSPPGTLTLDDFTDFSPVVKEGLRLAVHGNRLCGGGGGDGGGGGHSRVGVDLSSDGASSSSDRTADYSRSGSKREYTHEDLERRRRRRDRNKIAAAKCRNKKKEKTDGLQQESEKLESVNADLKAQIEELKQQKQQLVYMLNLHRPTCIVRAQHGQTPEDERNLFLQHIKESTLQLHNLTSSCSSSSSTSSSSCSASTNTVSSMANSLSSAIVAPPPVGRLSLSEVRCAGLEAMDTLQSSCLQL